jgi:hypothetical protein
MTGPSEYSNGIPISIKGKEFIDPLSNRHLLEKVSASFSYIYIALASEERLTASVIYWTEFLATDPDVRVRFPALPDFLRGRGSGTGSIQPRE